MTGTCLVLATFEAGSHTCAGRPRIVAASVPAWKLASVMLRPDTAPFARLLSVLALLLSGLLLSPSALPAPPLDVLEAGRADSLARSLPWDVSLDRRSAQPHELGVQSVVIEQESRKGAAAGLRHARVYQYDHRHRIARRVRVDLNSGRPLDSVPVQGHHLPLNDVERRWALSKLAAAPRLLARMRAEQQRLGRPAFKSLDELDLKASVFLPADPTHPCARERCALLALFDASRTVFALEPVVRYASGKVSTLGALDEGAPGELAGDR